jgi:hypothetical protein
VGPSVNVTLWSRALLHSRGSHHFMETESSLLHSQEFSTCPYPEPDQSTPPVLSRRSILMLSTRLCLVLPSSLFLHDVGILNAENLGDTW